MRKKKIVDYVNTNQEATVEELANMFNVSVETIRRDLKALDEKELLVRVHGGATIKQTNDVGTSFNNRAKNNIESKQLLVDEAMGEISEGAVIGLDASSSSWLFAQAMPNILCTVVTNSINVILALEKKRNISIISLGGNYSEKYKAFYGKNANDNLREMNLDLCIISCVGFSESSGVWDSNEYNCDIKKTLISVSDKSILIADKSKLNRKSLLRICNYSDINLVITDAI